MSDQPVTPDREALKLGRELGEVAQALRSQADISDRTGQWSDLIDLSRRVEEVRPLLTEALDRARQQGKREGREEAETMRGDVHHHLNPLIGFLRTDVHLGRSSDGRRQHLIERMYACMDAADAALGEKPIA